MTDIEAVSPIEFLCYVVFEKKIYEPWQGLIDRSSLAKTFAVGL